MHNCRPCRLTYIDSPNLEPGLSAWAIKRIGSANLKSDFSDKSRPCRPWSGSLLKAIFSFLFIFFFSFLAAIEVNISAEMDPYNVADAPLKGTVSILHSKDQVVNKKSFKIGKDPLNVAFVKDVLFSKNDNTILSVYNFTLPAKPAGLEMLPEITATVAGKTYHSTPVSYTIGDADKAPATPNDPIPTTTSSSPAASKQTNRSGKIPIILRLENMIEGSLILYPKQRLTVGYRFLFNFNVDLSKEELPLLSPDGFEKIGAKQTKSYMQEDMNVFEVRQLIEAKKTGVFKIPSGEISGTAYRILPSGSRENAPKESRASSEPVEITVLPFPEKDQPNSFNGAIGQNLTLSTKLLSNERVEIGDKLTILIQISGQGELDTLPLPTICCQPGFSGFFILSDLPPTEKVEDQSKTFTVELRPQTSEIKEIPKLELAYFDPETKTYKTSISSSIPIKVHPSEKKAGEAPPLHSNEHQTTNAQDTLPRLEAIEIAHNEPITEKDLHNRLLGTWWALLILPIGIFCLLLQIGHKNNLLKQKSIVKPMTSSELFRKAIQSPPESAAFFVQIQQAFLLKLFERGEIQSIHTSPDFLPTEGPSGKVHALIREMEEKRFAISRGAIDAAFLTKIEKLFEEL